jgi:hypothetical protein
MNVRVRLVLFILLSCCVARSQTTASIPAFTAYAWPAEESSEEDESKMFSTVSGLHNWTDPGKEITFHFKLRSRGGLIISLLLKNDNPGTIHYRLQIPGFTPCTFLPQ